MKRARILGARSIPRGSVGVDEAGPALSSRANDEPAGRHQEVDHVLAEHCAGPRNHEPLVTFSDDAPVPEQPVSPARAKPELGEDRRGDERGLGTWVRVR